MAQAASKIPNETGPNELKIGDRASLDPTWTGKSPILEHYGDTIFPSLSDQTQMDIVHQFEDVRQRLKSHLAGAPRHRQQDSKDSVESFVSRLRASSAGSQTSAPSDSSFPRSFSPSSFTSSLSTAPTSAASSSGRSWNLESRQGKKANHDAPVTGANITDVNSLSAEEHLAAQSQSPAISRRSSVQSSNSWYNWVFEHFGDKPTPTIPDERPEAPSPGLRHRKPSALSLSSSHYSHPEVEPVVSSSLDSNYPGLDSAASWGVESSPWNSDSQESLPFARVPSPLHVEKSPTMSSPGLSSYVSMTSMSQRSQPVSLPTTRYQLPHSRKAKQAAKTRSLDYATQERASEPSVSYFCTTGGCKKLHSFNTFSAYLRHERAHWMRYPCPLCTPSTLLKSITCNCADNPTPIGYHLERHRHDFREQGLCSKSFIRKDKLRQHLTKPRLRGGHHLSATQARNLIEDSAYQIRQVTACGICEDPTLFYSHETAAEHFWSHWCTGHKITDWSEARVVRKLIESRPQMQKTWKVVASLCGVDPDLSHMSWKHAQARDLRFELEAGCKSFSELAWMAFEMAEKQVSFALPRWSLEDGYEDFREDEREALSPSPLFSPMRERPRDAEWPLDRLQGELGMGRKSHVASMVRRVDSIPHIPPPVPPKDRYARRYGCERGDW